MSHGHWSKVIQNLMEKLIREEMWAEVSVKNNLDDGWTDRFLGSSTTGKCYRQFRSATYIFLVLSPNILQKKSVAYGNNLFK